MDLVSRLKQYLDLRQISVTQFADVCGIPRPTASQLLAGRNKKVSDEIIGKIHQYYPDLSIIWMMFGEGNMLTGDNNTNTQMSTSGETVESIPHSPSLLTDDAEAEFEFAKPEDADANPNTDVAAVKSEFSFANTSNFDSQTSDDELSTTEDIHTFEFANSKNNAKQIEQEPNMQTQTASVKSGIGKRVTGIVVYYDDQTYESFIPDPEHRHPFMWH